MKIIKSSSFQNQFWPTVRRVAQDLSYEWFTHNACMTMPIGTIELFALVDDYVAESLFAQAEETKKKIKSHRARKYIDLEVVDRNWKDVVEEYKKYYNIDIISNHAWNWN